MSEPYCFLSSFPMILLEKDGGGDGGWAPVRENERNVFVVLMRENEKEKSRRP